MTWHNDQIQGRPDDAEREKLLAERSAIEQQLKKLKETPIGSRSNAAAQGRQEDLLALARKMVSIDKKLVRIQ